MRIGVDYYPEHWDEELWTRDAQLMTETGVKLVQLAEFAWCRLEPSDGQFDFGWLDKAIGVFTDNGIDVVIGTPTNCPPRWREASGNTAGGRQRQNKPHRNTRTPLL